MRTPMVRLAAAKRRLLDAEGECPHWDYDQDGDGHDCCDEVRLARREVRLARAALK